MLFIWIELLKFIKKNAVKIIIGTIALTSLYVGFNYLTTYRHMSNLEDDKQDTHFRPDAKPAHFYFFISGAEGEAFTNNLLIEQYIMLPEVLQEASLETNTNLKDVIETSDNIAIVPYHDLGPVKVLGLSRDGNTHLNELYINIGNEEDNLKIAKYFYNYIINDGLSILEDKNIYVFKEPAIKDVGEYSPLLTEKVTEEGSTSRKLSTDIVIGAILGGVVTTGILLLITFITKNLVYSFSYSLRETDYFFLVDEKINYTDELLELLKNQSLSNQVIINMDSNEITNNRFNTILRKTKKESNLVTANNITEVKDLSIVNRIVYVIYEGTTTREWYNKQRKLDRIYNVPTVVIQVNEKNTK